LSSDHALYPLSAFCARAGIEVPAFRPIAHVDVPAPYRQLLVHSRDMTSVLQEFHGQRIHLEHVELRQDAERVLRQVVLTLEDGRPVEFGAIEISLDPLPPPAQQDVLACHIPLGAILNGHNIAYTSKTRGFFEVDASDVIARALGIEGSTRLYGRTNDLFASTGNILAQVVEILPPVS
jgi:chorismate-pyruvate lyase